MPRRDEAELVEQQVVYFLGLGVVFPLQFAAVCGGDGHVALLDLGQPLQRAGGTQARRVILVELFKGGIQTIGKKADEDLGFNAFVELVKDGARLEIVLEGAEVFSDVNEVDLVA